jgi:catechol 2,3-dioxygenase-like lactoylglutathione lyase family enzyme
MLPELSRGHTYCALHNIVTCPPSCGVVRACEMLRECGEISGTRALICILRLLSCAGPQSIDSQPRASILMTRPNTQAISPFFIVSSVDQTIGFYRDKLGFETRFREPDQNPFFAIIGRDGAQLFIKSDKDVSPLPNPKRHPSMRWDAFVYAPDPDALAAEFADHGAAFSVPLKDTHDGLRGFEICDPDGYVLFFGRPR